jgi:hypothetical protein
VFDCLPRIIIFLICCMISRRIILLRIIEILLGIWLTIALRIRLSNCAFDNTIITIVVVSAIIIGHPAAIASAHLCVSNTSDTRRFAMGKCEDS